MTYGASSGIGSTGSLPVCSGAHSNEKSSDDEGDPRVGGVCLKHKPVFPLHFPANCPAASGLFPFEKGDPL